MTVNILSLGIDMIVVAMLIGYASMLVIALSALVESIIDREFGVFILSLMLVLFLVGLGSFFAGLITQ